MAREICFNKIPEGKLTAGWGSTRAPSEHAGGSAGNPSSIDVHLRSMPPRTHHTRGRPAEKLNADELRATRERMNRAGAEFLKIDMETALTFVQIARETGNDSRKRRNVRAARTAHDTALKLMPKLDLTVEDAQVLKSRLGRLRSELEALGESF